MKISPQFELYGPAKAYEIIFDTEDEANEITMLLEVLRLRSRNEAREVIVRDCEHKWVDADNEVVKGTKICLKCRDIREK